MTIKHEKIMKILELSSSGFSDSKIAKSVGVCRKTVRKYKNSYGNIRKSTHDTRTQATSGAAWSSVNEGGAVTPQNDPKFHCRNNQQQEPLQNVCAFDKDSPKSLSKRNDEHETFVQEALEEIKEVLGNLQQDVNGLKEDVTTATQATSNMKKEVGDIQRQINTIHKDLNQWKNQQQVTPANQLNQSLDPSLKALNTKVDSIECKMTSMDKALNKIPEVIQKYLNVKDNEQKTVTQNVEALKDMVYKLVNNAIGQHTTRTTEELKHYQSAGLEPILKLLTNLSSLADQQNKELSNINGINTQILESMNSDSSIFDWFPLINFIVSIAILQYIININTNIARVSQPRTVSLIPLSGKDEKEKK